MRKEFINKLIKRFGVELHGSGYISKLISRQQNKSSFESQAKILDYKAKVIFDVGANRGLTTAEYLKYFPDAEIHAFEPFSDFFPLWQNITASNKKIYFNQLGVSGKTGTASFNVNSNHDTNSILDTIKIGATSDANCRTVRKETIEVISIDEYCSLNNIDQIDIIKIDTQGSELAILKGMKNMLTNKKVKLIYTEAYFKQQYADQPLLFDIAKYLQQFGYFIQDMYDPFYNDKLILWCDTIFIPV